MMTKRLFAILIWALVVTAVLPAWATTEKPGSASMLKVKGDALYNASRFSEALEYYTAALDKAKAAGDRHIYNACIGNISNVYGMTGDTERALHYLNMGYKASEEAGDSVMMQKFATNIAALYCRVGEVDKAKVFLKRQLQLSSGDPTQDQYYALNNQGFIASLEKNYQQAQFYHQAALNFVTERQMDEKYAISQLINLGGVSMSTHQIAQAIDRFKQAEQRATAAGEIEMQCQIYKQLAMAYTAAGDSAMAARYKAMYVTISDSIYDRNRFNAASSKLFEYENAENQKHIDRLVSRNHTQLLIILAFAALAIALTLLYLALRRKNRRLQEAQRLLVSKNEELLKSDKQNRQLLQHYVDGENKQQDERNDIGLTQEAIDQLLSRINGVMQQVDVISASDFNLNQLAQLTDSNTKYVSWVINDVYGKNFKTFLNEYRIKEACRRLSDNEHYGHMTLQAIYQDLGYQSATSFINAFKRSMGMTPSTYQRLARERSDDLPHTDGADDGV